MAEYDVSRAGTSVGFILTYEDPSGRTEYWAFVHQIEASGNDNGNLGPFPTPALATQAIWRVAP